MCENVNFRKSKNQTGFVDFFCYFLSFLKDSQEILEIETLFAMWIEVLKFKEGNAIQEYFINPMLETLKLKVNYDNETLVEFTSLLINFAITHEKYFNVILENAQLNVFLF